MSSWKNSKGAFDQQLELNLRQIEGDVNTYPPNWSYILDYISNFMNEDSNINSIVELGCGVGALSKVILQWFPELSYGGCDDASYAIELAYEYFGKYQDAGFSIHNIDSVEFYNLGYDIIGMGGYGDNEIVIANALCDVMEDGDGVFKEILEASPKYAIFSRMKVVEEESHADPYQAYGCVNTFAFHHNREGLLDMIKEFGYNYEKEVVNGDWELAIWK